MKSKLAVPAPAKDLYRSPLFERRRRYAEGSGVAWFVVSSRWGLVEPDEVIAPYDLYLGDCSAAYQRAWGVFVVEQLAQVAGPLQGLVVEVHAGEHYRAALAPALQRHSAVLVNPVVASSMGATLAWYDTPQLERPGPSVKDREAQPGRSGAEGDSQPSPVEAAIVRLLDPKERLRVDAFLESERSIWSRPGLYSWWVDEAGAAQLSQGLGAVVEPGLIYAGQAGATRFPSGRRSTNTLWTRLAGMHLGSRAEFSTFRRTLATALREPLALRDEDDPRLSEWITEHLTLAAVPVDDADALGRLEDEVLRRLDPPLNLQGMVKNDLRTRLSNLRSGRP